MDNTYVLVLILGLIFVFLFAIKKFSRQIENIAGEKFKYYLTLLTKTPLRGTALGAAITSVIQSSTATTLLLVGLVDAGLISFTNSLGVVFGANIGTTITSQLVAFRILYVAPFIVVAGFLWERLNLPGKRYGRPIFYFGLAFLCLMLVSELIKPISSSPEFLSLIGRIDNILIAVVAGFIITIVFQSSSVVAGLVILLASQNILNFDQALGIILGSNIGTPITALIASSIMNKSAKRTALAHFLYNFLGVVLFLPLLRPFSLLIEYIGGPMANKVANAHLIFNLTIAVVFLIFVKPFSKLIINLTK